MCLDCEFCPQTHGKQLATTKKNGFIEGIHEHNLCNKVQQNVKFNKVDFLPISTGRAHDRSIIEYNYIVGRPAKFKCL